MTKIVVIGSLLQKGFMKDSRFSEIIKQSAKLVNLNLKGLNVLVPSVVQDSSIMPLIAGMVGANEVFVMSKDVEAINKITRISEELELTTKYHFIEEETPEILSGLDILVKGKKVSEVCSNYVSRLKSSCVISIYPEKFDFRSSQGIDLDCCSSKGISVLMFNPGDPLLNIYKYFAHFLLKRCYEARLEVFKSRILIIGNGEMLDNSISLFKSCGAQVYGYYTDKGQDKNYIKKHLGELDALIIADYPQTADNIISNNENDLVHIEDLLDNNKDIKIIHFSGKVDVRALNFSNIFHHPQIITKEFINFDDDDAGLRMLSDICTGVLKSAELFIKKQNLTIQSKEDILSFRVINAQKNKKFGALY